MEASLRPFFHRLALLVRFGSEGETRGFAIGLGKGWLLLYLLELGFVVVASRSARFVEFLVAI